MGKTAFGTQKNKAMPSSSAVSQKVIAGVDEAGRGPVIGPLVMAALAFREEDLKKLKWLGVKDSKLLSAERRVELFEQIHAIVHDFRVEVIEPDAIDLSLKDDSSNLNWLEAETAARMLSEMEADTLIIDCPSPNIPAYKDFVWQRLGKERQKEAQLIVEHKADVNHLPVAAASIVAKVIRDRHIEHLKKEVGIDFGSGYLTDPKTTAFLEKHHSTHQQLFRKGWQSYKDVLEKKKQKKLGEF